mmetsp:Transcript_844/g.3047  ORF Transcript_844/g.3047 Transcript_844/m.3047 type:complete len:419 (+) Transcript_844:358-1614(+)
MTSAALIAREEIRRRISGSIASLAARSQRTAMPRACAAALALEGPGQSAGLGRAPARPIGTLHKPPGAAGGMTRAAATETRNDGSNSYAEAAMLWQVQEQARVAAAEVVPWFLENMPAAYFDEVPQEMQISHVRAISSLFLHHSSDRELMVTNLDEAGRGRVTLFIPQDRPGQLYAMLQSLSGVTSEELIDVRAYITKDHSLGIDVFRFGDPECPDRGIREGHMDLVRSLHGDECVALEVKHTEVPEGARTEIAVAAPNVWPKLALQRLSRYLGSKGLNIESVKLNVIPDSTSPGEAVTLITVGVEARQEVDWLELEEEIPRVTKFVDDVVLNTYVANPQYSLQQMEVVNAFCNLIHPMLAPTDRYAFARPRILQVIHGTPSHLSIAASAATAFINRHDPAGSGCSEAEWAETLNLEP